MSTTLLLADDSPTIAKILQMALANDSYAIRAVLTAEEAITELKKQPPSIFLVDLNLPSKNGYEFARLIRRDSKLRDVRVVLLASAFEPVDEGEYASCGADGLVKKPFDPAELRAKLRSLLEAPVKFPDSARVTGSLSGFMVADPQDSTRTNLTIGGLTTNAVSDTSSNVIKGGQGVAPLMGGAPPKSPGDPATGLLIPQDDAPAASGSDADAILAGLLAPDAPPTQPPASPPYDTGEFRPDKTILLDMNEAAPIPKGAPVEQVLDLSSAFGKTQVGTQAIELGTHTVNVTKADLPPPTPPRGKPSSEAPPAAPSSKPSAPTADDSLSANAQALAAFFEAELHGNPAEAASAPAKPPPLASPAPGPEDAFDASLDSIDWGSGPANASLDQWSSGGGAKPNTRKVPAAETPPPFVSAPAHQDPARGEANLAGRGSTSPGFVPKPAAAPTKPAAAPPRAAARGGEASMLFDTGGSSFRFSEDYIQRITKSFTGAENETIPETHPIFPQQSDDRSQPAPSPETAAPSGTPATGFGGGAWSENDVQKIEQIVREEVQMVVREVAEKIAWEVIPELAENIIRKELEKVLKDMGQ